ncbi:MAG: 50S ribosomal protein L10 [Anaerolineae bacterium]|nr:50S ribosomal protein L10 [Anaerolineae bacterium]
MAFTKEQKTKMVADYEQMLRESQAVFMMSYNHMTMKEIDSLRVKVREAGGKAHVVKNTLFEIALKNANLPHEGELTQTTLVGFAVEDAPALAKVFADASKSDVFQLKGGFMDNAYLDAAHIKALADLPPLPVVQAQLLGVLQAPASQLVRTLVEPARMVAAVVKAYSEQEPIPAPL